MSSSPLHTPSPDFLVSAPPGMNWHVDSDAEASGWLQTYSGILVLTGHGGVEKRDFGSVHCWMKYFHLEVDDF